ncbi:MAG TPA: sugar ABC transporter permease [Anaerolineae bacterium]|nr:sugar ABC transporter permease [Anaerolineae bacterium]
MYQRSRRKLVIPFLAPALLLYTALLFIPLVQTMWRSLTNWYGHGGERVFWGLRNYRLMFMDPQFLNAAKNTGLFALSGGVILFIPAVFVSWALTQRIRGRSIFRYIIVAPVVLSTVSVALLWKLLYDPVFGPINNLLRAIGLEQLALPWLGDPRTALLAVVIAATWQQLGTWVILLSAGLERVPVELLEAARIDGASEWKVFWKVTLPLVWGVLRLLIIVWLISSLQVFGQVYVMTPAGSVGGSTTVVGILIYERAFHSYQWGLACAMATFLMIVILVVSLVANKLTKRESIEY